MRKFIVALCALVIAVSASAQSRAIGLRAGYGGELSYQHSLGANFLEADLGFNIGHGISLAAVYDFHLGNFNIGDAEFGWYAGPGAQAVLYDRGDNTMGLSAAILGQIGMEFFFPGAPVQLSLDWRPAFHLVGYTGFYWTGIALGIRYAF